MAETTETVSLPSAPRVSIAHNVYLQPPLSRRGTGPSLVLFVPNVASLATTTPLDPEPITKWAEEGFAVAAIVASSSDAIESSLKLAIDGLQALESVDVKDKLAIIGTVSLISNNVSGFLKLSFCYVQYMIPR